MAGSNLKHPTASDAQVRRKKNKTSKPKHAADQALRSDQSEALMEATDMEVEEFEDNENTWNPFASQVIRAVEQVKKPDHWPREFAKSVKERQKFLLEEVHVKCQVMLAGQQQFKTRFHNAIAAALNLVGTERTSAPHALLITHVRPHGQPLYKKCCILIEESRNLIAEYHQLAQQRSETSRAEELSKKFITDKDQAARAIAAGRRVAKADIDDMLADRLHEVRGRKAIAADDETLGREILQVGCNQRPELAELDGERWGKVAYRAQRAVQRLSDVTVMAE